MSRSEMVASKGVSKLLLLHRLKLNGAITKDGFRIVHGDHYVADVYGNNAEQLCTLLSAAPDLLRALELAWLHLQSGSQKDWQKQIVDAIAKAKGIC